MIKNPGSGIRRGKAPPKNLLPEVRELMHNREMKSAYEIAMERLNKTAPAARLTGKQKKQLAELDSRYTAKIAEREIALKGEMAKAAGDFEKEKSLREQLVHDRKKLQAELEDKKEQVRRGAAA